MLEQTLEKVIFSLDKTDTHSLAKFTRHFDTLRAMCETVGGLVQVIGSYNGKLEVSYMCTSLDFIMFILGKGYVDEQESFLFVPADTRQPCSLRSFTKGVHGPLVVEETVLGPMREIQFYHTTLMNGWTYVPQTGKYFTCDK